MKKKILGILLSLSMAMSGLTAVYAEVESVKISVNKPIEAGIDGTGSWHSDTGLHGTPEVMVDGVNGSDQNGAASNKAKMWYGRSTAATDTIYLNLDLEDNYVITKIIWRSRYRDNDYANDYCGMKIYGANSDDYSDKTLIYTVPADLTNQNVEFVIAEEDIATYRYIRFEKTKNMGGQELSVYGYKDPASNAYLSDLSIDGYSFTNSFQADQTEYTVVTTALPETDKVTVNAAAQGTGAAVVGDGEIEIPDYGINTIPITVTSENGAETKTYTIKFIVAADVSSVVTAHGNNVYTGTSKDDLVSSDSYCTQLFTSNVKRWQVYIYREEDGYIQADLGEEYNLCGFQYTKSNLEKGEQLTVKASNDVDFANAVTLGTVKALKASETSAMLAWEPGQTYRYVRIEKTNLTHDFLPLTMRLYAIKPSAQMTDISTGLATAADNFEISFDDTLAEVSEAAASTIKVTKGDTVVPVTVTAADNKLIISPQTEWEAGGIYKLEIPRKTIAFADGRVYTQNIEQYFAVSTDTLDITNISVTESEINISATNKLSESINITRWNVPLNGNVVSGTIDEDTFTIASGGVYNDTISLTDEYAVYWFEDVANMKTYLPPITTAACTKADYESSEEPLTAKYVDGNITVSGKFEQTKAEQVIAFVVNSATVAASSVKAVAMLPVTEGAYAGTITLTDIATDNYTVWTSDGDNVAKTTDEYFVMSEAQKDAYVADIDSMNAENLAVCLTTDLEKLTGIGVIEERPANMSEVCAAIAAIDFSALPPQVDASGNTVSLYKVVVNEINEQLAVAIAKEKGVVYALDNYSSILASESTDQNYKFVTDNFSYIKDNNLSASVTAFMTSTYTDAASFNSAAAYAFKLAMFQNAPSFEYAKTLLSEHNSVYGFDLTGKYASLSALNQWSVLQSAQKGTTPQMMIANFNSAVTTYSGTTNIPSYTPTGGGGGGGGGGISVVPKSDLPLPEVKLEEEKPTGFSDMDENHWAYETIMTLVEQGIVNGTDGKFMPDENVTREQFVKMLVLAAKIKAEGEISFEDVPSDAWHYDYVASAKNSGIVNGVSEVRFGTGLNITRQDMTVMIYNTMKFVGKTFDDSAAELTFDDTEEIKDYAIEAVQQLGAAGVINGRDNNMFAPTGNATRAEAATIICRMLDLIA